MPLVNHIPLVVIKPKPGQSTASKPPARPIVTPPEIESARLAICTLCENNSNGRCRLFACCEKDIATQVKLATGPCPAGKWPAWIPPRPQ